MTENFEIGTYLVASTAHITNIDNTYLTEYPESSGLIIYHYEYGYWIHTNSNEFVSDGQLSIAFWNLLKLAKGQGCLFLKLDCDGPVYDSLSTFIW